MDDHMYAEILERWRQAMVQHGGHAYTARRAAARGIVEAKQLEAREPLAFG